MEEIVWHCKEFHSLSTSELYGLLRLRSEVFHVEQNCAYNDLDNRDQDSFHVFCLDKSGAMIAYARILPAGVSFREVSIGRVVTSGSARGEGLGKELMDQCMKNILSHFGKVPVRIGAQCYLKKFYEEFGFEVDSVEYMEDNIPHIEMLHP